MEERMLRIERWIRETSQQQQSVPSLATVLEEDEDLHPGTSFSDMMVALPGRYPASVTFVASDSIGLVINDLPGKYPPSMIAQSFSPPPAISNPSSAIGGISMPGRFPASAISSSATSLKTGRLIAALPGRFPASATARTVDETDSMTLTRNAVSPSPVVTTAVESDTASEDGGVTLHSGSTSSWETVSDSTLSIVESAPTPRQSKQNDASEFQHFADMASQVHEELAAISADVARLGEGIDAVAAELESKRRAE